MAQDSQATGLEDDDDAGDSNEDTDLEEDDDSPNANDSSDDEDSGGDDDGEADEDAPDLAEVLEGLTDKATFDQFKQDTTRGLGHVRSLQRSVDGMKDLPTEVGATRDLVMSIAEHVLPLLQESGTGEALATVIEAAREEARDKRIADKIRGETKVKSDDDADMSPEVAAAWDTASATVRGYAEAKGIDPEDITAEQWNDGLATGDPTRAAKMLKLVVDALAKGESPGKRRAAKKATGKKQASPEKAGGSSAGSLTISKLKKMSEEEVAELDLDEVDRVLAGS